MVSVIVPVYNSKNTLNKCVDSILTQHGVEYELILIDDGSEDGSSMICDNYAKDHNNIKVIHQQNMGVSVARNRGLCEADGKYIVFVDSDDIIEKDYLFELLHAITINGTDMAICGYKLKTKDGVRSVVEHNKVYRFEDFLTFKELSSKMLLATPWGKMFIKEKIHEKYRTDIALGEDVCFVLSYMKGIDSLSIIDKPLYCYQTSTNENSLSKKYHNNLEQVVYAVDESKRCLFDVKYPDNAEAENFRIESLTSDVLLMVSKVLKTGTDLKDAYRMIGELLNYLNKECTEKQRKNKKVIIISVCYKFKLLAMLRVLYRIKAKK